MKWFSSYLTEREQYTSVNNVDSPINDICYRVQQGSALGPVLFLIYINDLNSAIEFSYYIRTLCRWYKYQGIIQEFNLGIGSHMSVTFWKRTLQLGGWGLGAGFPTGVENIVGAMAPIGVGALQNLMGGLKSIHGGSMGGLKCCRKIPVEEFIW